MSLHFRADGGLDMRFSSSHAAVSNGYYSSSGFSSSNNYSSPSYSSNNGSSNSLHLKSNGTPDMRFTSSKEAVKSGQYSSNTVIEPPKPINKTVNPDNVPLKKNGTPDMRFTSSKEAVKSGQYSSNTDIEPPKPINKTVNTNDIPIKKDGTPDMRFKSSKEVVKLGIMNSDTVVLPPKPKIIITTNNQVHKGCEAVRNGYVTLLENGQVDPECQAVKDGAIVLKKNGEISMRSPLYSEMKRIAYKDLSTDTFRDRNTQNNVHKEYKKNGGKKDIHAAHKVSLQVVLEILSKRSGLPLTQEEIKKQINEINNHLERETPRQNLIRDKKNDEKFIDALNNKEIKMTRSFEKHCQRMLETLKQIRNDGKMTELLDYVEQKIIETVNKLN